VSEPGRGTPPLANSYWAVDGMLLAGEYPGDIDPVRARARLASLLDAGVRQFVDLTHPHELAPYEAILAEEAARRGIEVRYARLPIVDMDVPTLERMREIIAMLEEAERAGRPAYVHCWGGVGRTGTTMACWFVHRGATPVAALESVAALFATMSDEKRRRHVNGSPETPAQRAFVTSWSETRHGEAPRA
jgi:hypothetical protein